jgi:transposase-like protein
MSTKIRPSEQKHKLFQQLINREDPDLFREFFKRGMEKLLQESVEGEVTDFLGRAWYEHQQEETSKRGYRNGYYDRQVLTAEGPLHIRQPRVRESAEVFESKILARLDRLEVRLKELAGELYVRGLSTRDIEQTFVDDEGNALLSRSTVSRLNEKLNEEYESFRKRDLSQFDVVYLFADGVYEAIRGYTSNQAILCAWGICGDGTKTLLHVAAVQSESAEAWTVFFEDMLSRGLRQPLLATSDGAKGIHKAIGECFPRADRQRCLAHKLRNILVKLPKDKQQEVMEKIRAVYYAPDEETAKLLAAHVIDQYAVVYPSAIQTFSEDLDACIVHLRYPSGHRRYIRTTNLLERAFEEEKRRTKVIPQHVHERGAMGLVFAVLWRASNSWQRIQMTELELAQLKHIRTLICPEQHESNFISYRLVG